MCISKCIKNLRAPSRSRGDNSLPSHTRKMIRYISKPFAAMLNAPRIKIIYTILHQFNVLTKCRRRAIGISEPFSSIVPFRLFSSKTVQRQICSLSIPFIYLSVSSASLSIPVDSWIALHLFLLTKLFNH